MTLTKVDSARVIYLVALGTFWAILLALTIDIAQREMGKPFIYSAEMAQAEAPEEVLIEAKIDWTEERIEKEIRKTFPENPDLAVAIAKAESVGLNKDAYNPEAHKDEKGKVICNGSYGVMQIACIHHRNNPKELFDVSTNLKEAQEIYEASGKTFKQWGAYTDGSYKRYMPR